MREKWHSLESLSKKPPKANKFPEYEGGDQTFALEQFLSQGLEPCASAEHPGQDLKPEFEQAAYASQNAMRQKLPELLKQLEETEPLKTEADEAAQREKKRFRKMAVRLLPYAAVVIIGIFGTALHANGGLNINLQSGERANGGIHISPTDLANQDSTDVNRTFREIADVLGCPRIELNKYAQSVFCEGSEIDEKAQKAIASVVVKKDTVHFEIRTPDENYSQVDSLFLDEVERIIIEDKEMIVYRDRMHDTYEQYIAQCVESNFVVTVRAVMEYEMFRLFIEDITICN